MLQAHSGTSLFSRKAQGGATPQLCILAALTDTERTCPLVIGERPHDAVERAWGQADLFQFSVCRSLTVPSGKPFTRRRLTFPGAQPDGKSHQLDALCEAPTRGHA